MDGGIKVPFKLKTKTNRNLKVESGKAINCIMKKLWSGPKAIND